MTCYSSGMAKMSRKEPRQTIASFPNSPVLPQTAKVFEEAMALVRAKARKEALARIKKVKR